MKREEEGAVLRDASRLDLGAIRHGSQIAISRPAKSVRNGRLLEAGEAGLEFLEFPVSASAIPCSGLTNSLFRSSTAAQQQCPKTPMAWDRTRFSLAGADENSLLFSLLAGNSETDTTSRKCGDAGG
jgi:hypothetical protein